MVQYQVIRGDLPTAALNKVMLPRLNVSSAVGPINIDSGVASYGAFGYVPHSSVVHSAAAVSLPVKISKIRSTKEKHVLQFRPSRQKHAKTHVNRLKQYQN